MRASLVILAMAVLAAMAAQGNQEEASLVALSFFVLIRRRRQSNADANPEELVRQVFPRSAASLDKIAPPASTPQGPSVVAQGIVKMDMVSAEEEALHAKGSRVRPVIWFVARCVTGSKA